MTHLRHCGLNAPAAGSLRHYTFRCTGLGRKPATNNVDVAAEVVKLISERQRKANMAHCILYAFEFGLLLTHVAIAFVEVD
jgi:hypothetical protein